MENRKEVEFRRWWKVLEVLSNKRFKQAQMVPADCSLSSVVVLFFSVVRYAENAVHLQ